MFGAGTSTKVMARLVLISQFQANQTDSYAAFVITMPGGTQ
jgi:hypothetical protein